MFELENEAGVGDGLAGLVVGDHRLLLVDQLRQLLLGQTLRVSGLLNCNLEVMRDSRGWSGLETSRKILSTFVFLLVQHLGDVLVVELAFVCVLD